MRLSAALGAAAALGGVGGPARADTLAAARDAAAARRQALGAVEVAWDLTVDAPKGGRMDPDPAGLPLRRKDLRAHSAHRLRVAADGRYRLDHDGPDWKATGLGPPDGSFAFDGTRPASRLSLDGRAVPATLIWDQPGTGDIPADPYTRPVCLWCWWPAGGLGGRDARAASEAEVMIDGVPHREVRVRHPSGGVTLYAFDPARGHVVRRIREEEADGRLTVTDMEYRADPAGGWAPAGWTGERTRPPGVVVERARAEVTAVRVGAGPPADAFRLDPVPGGTVVDAETRAEHRVGPDGALEPIDRAAGPPVAEPGRARGPLGWPGRGLVRYGLLPALAVALAAAVVYRRRTRRCPRPAGLE
jgi:hypothetical protein